MPGLFSAPHAHLISLWRVTERPAARRASINTKSELLLIQLEICREEERQKGYPVWTSERASERCNARKRTAKLKMLSFIRLAVRKRGLGSRSRLSRLTRSRSATTNCEREILVHLSRNVSSTWHYKVGQVSLLTTAKPAETPDERKGRGRMTRERIEWEENSHLFRSRRTRASTRARSPSCSCSFLAGCCSRRCRWNIGNRRGSAKIGGNKGTVDCIVVRFCRRSCGGSCVVYYT